MQRPMGIPWYKREDFDKLLSTFADADMLFAAFASLSDSPLTYDAWLKKAEEFEKQMQGAGLQPFRVFLDPVEFPMWCEEHGHTTDVQGRSAYATAKAAEAQSSGAGLDQPD